MTMISCGYQWLEDEGESHVCDVLIDAPHRHKCSCGRVEALAGAWFVFGYDMNAYPIALYHNELEALRLVEKNGYGHVKFWPFGSEWEG